MNWDTHTSSRLRTLWISVGVPVLCAVAVPAYAQKLDLTVSSAAITFASANPDTSPTIAAAPLTVQIRVRQNTGPWQLTVLANGDLISGPSTVDITNVTWTATPAPPFQNGTVSKSVAQRMASGSGNVNPATNGSVTFRLVNSWNYTAATYSQTLVFTLSAP
jgi:hypothetical protein